MKNLIFLLSLTLGLTAFAQQPLDSSTVKYERQLRGPKRMKKNIIQLELLGRGVFYGLGYERMVTPEISLGTSLSYTKINLNPYFIETEFQVITMPLYMNYYVNPGRHNFVLTGGLTVFSIEAKARFNDATTVALNEYQDSNPDGNVAPFSFEEIEATTSGVIALPQAGMGYEFRGTSGFMTRANLYAFYVGKIVPFLGLSVGVAF
ncbi:MAG: hypothetical protein K0R29_1609 [Pseudobdellovibrio sp.]|nr:hypothetical protein [Pseudobdellovibrio sp.]